MSPQRPVDAQTLTDTNMANISQIYHINHFSDEAIHIHTGLTCREKFDMVLSTLGDGRFHLSYYYESKPRLCVEDQLLLTLMKLRHHPSNKILACNFNINPKMVSNIFITWINFIYLQWKRIMWWPERELVHFFAPDGFKKSYPKTRAILDGTECPIHKPSNPRAQRATFSTYKNRNTAKVVVGITPSGLVSYVSQAYGGSASDRQIVERSDLMQLTDPGDELMVDKGFNCEDLFISNRVTLNIPTFFKKKNRLNSETVIKDRKIASKRVHVERVIGLAKTYRILKEPMNDVETALSTQIISICFWLVNFRLCIIPKSG